MVACWAASLAATVFVAAPPGAEDLSVRWVRATVPGGTVLAAVARPEGHGPFPAVVVLHGTHGFAREYVGLAIGIARHGVLAVAPCWFAGRRGEGVRFVTPIECAEAPPMPPAGSVEAERVIDGILETVRALPDVRGDNVALFGHSRGGGAALNYALGGGRISGAVLHSAGFPLEVTVRAADVRVPVLMLHGAADGPADGGSPVTDARMARAFEEALRRAGRSVEAKFYPRAGHNAIFTSAAQRDDTIRRIAAFVRRRRE